MSLTKSEVNHLHKTPPTQLIDNNWFFFEASQIHV